ncbi:uncharacterized protein [Procambarus clarkii]|uniref:uncharacterized protein n=1 Tax=Procambarus clarkii TaxID=6728 RepID=UPI001E670A13|nr:uncharacterized protein LOC123770381 [Procambarus clarkii]
MESTETVVDEERKRRPPLLRRHTLGTSPPAGHLGGGGERRRVARAASEDRWAAGRGGDSTPCTTKRGSTHASSIVARARRLAWSGIPAPDVKTETASTLAKASKRRSLARPQSCGTPISGVIPFQDVTLTLPEAQHRPLGSDKLEPEATALPATIAKVEVESQARDENDQHTKTSTKVIRSVSSPDIFYTGPPKLASYTDESQNRKLDLEPYDGLVIQKAPLITQEAKRIELSDEGDEADEEDNASEPQADSTLRGYRSRNGFGFIPFSKMFTKPLRASLLRRSSQSSQGEPNLGVENTFQTLSESERDVIKRTRSALKQRINSANNKSACNGKKKIQLSIVVNAQGDTDESAQASDENNEVPQLSFTLQDCTAERQSKTKSSRHNDREMPPPPTKTSSVSSLSRKKSRTKTEPKVSTTITKKAKKKEIPTIMSEISPVPSDVEQGLDSNQHGPLAEMHALHIRKRASSTLPDDGCGTDARDRGYDSTPDGLFAPARGELLQTIINESSMYAPVSQTWRGRKMHLEVRIRTDRAMVSTDEDEVSEIEDRRGPASHRRARTIQRSHELDPPSARTPAAATDATRTLPHRGARGTVLPANARPQPQHAHTAVLRAKERDKLRQILEVCSDKVEESKHLRRRLRAGGVWVSLDTLQRGLMSPTEYRVYQDHLRSLEEKEQQKKRPIRMSTSPSKR